MATSNDSLTSLLLLLLLLYTGISTLVENLFHTFQDSEEGEIHDGDNPERLGSEFWLTDYLRGTFCGGGGDEGGAGGGRGGGSGGGGDDDDVIPKRPEP